MTDDEKMSGPERSANRAKQTLDRWRMDAEQ